MQKDNIHTFVQNQLATWPLAADNFAALSKVHVREVDVNGLTVKLQFNPARMISSAAKLTKEDIARRRCFLCVENRPQEQVWQEFEAENAHRYHILVNPYPIFPDHLVIAKATHQDQAIAGRYADMLKLAGSFPECCLYYNGPRCGASAPDHHHFQGVPRGLMPLENSVDSALEYKAQPVILSPQPVILSEAKDLLNEICTYHSATLYHYDNFSTGIFVIASQSPESASVLFERLISSAEIPEDDIEPRINLFTWSIGQEYRTIVYFRKCHRSHHYFSEGPDHLTMSPGCADMAGVFIVPVEEEYHKITPELLSEMIAEITIPKEEQDRIMCRLRRTQPTLQVGIMAAEEIEFELLDDGKGLRKATVRDGRISLEGELHDELYFKAPQSVSRFAQPAFVLHGVTIGVKFHWERQEDQTFAGDLKIIVDGNRLRAINIIGVEDYLLSVISSEMSATASEEFLKAHAVISRSWVMARIQADRNFILPNDIYNLPDLVSWLYRTRDVAVYTSNEYMKWYDHDDHRLFDVCADDHCQRYQGLTRATGEKVRRVIDATWGQVLTHDGQLCDARFSKCCGGRMEKFSVCWQDKDYDYLQPLPDTPDHNPDAECFCNTQDKDILAQVLNNYDQETVDFYRWEEILDPVGLGGLIERKFGVMTGPVKALVPLQRGESGRICKLRIEGELKTITVGKELEIRRILSPTHLKSSAFDVEYITADGRTVIPDECMNEDGPADGQSEKWTKMRLRGRGWGHGVGLCQIGAAVMATRGYTYTQILAHYYPGSNVIAISGSDLS